MEKLRDLYTDFSRIDLDTRGGYARVAKVRTQGQKGFPEYCAFKLMRPEVEFQERMKRFEDEFNILLEITKDKNSPSAITRVYDSGFAPVELSQNLHEDETPDPSLEIICTGTDIKQFLKEKTTLENANPDDWLPYLVIELAPYDDSLFRQISQQPTIDPTGLYRLPTGEVITMALQLLDVMDYLNSKCHRAYMDWKPEHIFWSGLSKHVKLIDWNVTVSLDDGPGERQNTRDDLRLFCGAVLYIGLTFIDPENPAKPIGPRPTTELRSPIPQIRQRYLTEIPDFYQRGASLDEAIKKIIQRGLDPKQGFDTPAILRQVLLEYAQERLGLIGEELILPSEPSSPYYKAITEMRLAQQQLLRAQDHLIETVESHGNSLEFTRMFEVIKRALMNFPAS
jgi:serine/threonine protein kinase